MRVTVVGAGSWGTALAILLARNGHEVALMARNPEEVRALATDRENRHYLPGFALPEGISVVHLDHVVEASEMTVVAVPSGAVREVVSEIRGQHPLLVIAAKGLEAGTGKLMTQVAAEALPDAEIGAISGPNLAIEIVRGIPTAAVAAFAEAEVADQVRLAFACASFRVYRTDDVVGVELAGALKNVLAIGGGMSDGLGFGDNTKGALLARGLREITVLGQAMGARPETFLGVAGVGDLFATASSNLSRNYRVGRALGEGRALTDVLAQIGQVAEGVSTAAAVQVLSARHGVEMPVFRAIDMVIRGDLRPIDGVRFLMERNTAVEGF